jgi:asparagine synthetase A
LRRTCGIPLRARVESLIQAQIVQAATEWKRMALKQFECKIGEGIQNINDINSNLDKIKTGMGRGKKKFYVLFDQWLQDQV